MRRYRALLLAALGAAVLVSLLARLPHRARPQAPAATPPPVTAVTLELENGRLHPESASVPHGNLVRLSVVNYGLTSFTLRLAGYEDHLPPTVLAGGDTLRAEFLADRPGDDFAWFVDGRLAGRLNVTGSHLVEGHR